MRAVRPLHRNLRDDHRRSVRPEDQLTSQILRHHHSNLAMGSPCCGGSLGYNPLYDQCEGVASSSQ